MADYKEAVAKLENKLKTSGKIEVMNILCELVALQAKENNTIAQKNYLELMEKFREYLEFDPIPPDTLAESFLRASITILAAVSSKGIQGLHEKIKVFTEKKRGAFAKFAALPELYSLLGYIYHKLGDQSKAIRILQEVLVLVDKLKNPAVCPFRFTHLGNVYEAFNNPEKAVYYHEKSIELGHKIGNKQAIYLAHSNLGKIYSNKGDFKKAIDNLVIALSFFPEDELSVDKANIYNTIGSFYAKLGDLDKGKECFLKVCNEYYKTKVASVYCSAIMNLGNIYRLQNHIEQAFVYFTEAIELAEKLDSRQDLLAINIMIGQLMLSKQDYQKSVASMEKALQLAYESNDNYHIAFIKRDLARVYITENLLEKAVKEIKESAEMFDKLSYKADVSLCYQIMAEIYEKTGNHKEALEFYRKFTDIERELVDERTLAKIKTAEEEMKYKYAGNKTFGQTNGSLIEKELTEVINHDFIGSSQIMVETMDKIRIAAQNPDVNVLILGESGTGKEIIARIIHYKSNRSKYEFCSVNSSAFPESLIESSFFGYEKGAFTGAHERNIGYFESADKGTLFLDEIGDMPVFMQSKLIRVLEEKVISRIGSTNKINLDFRLISATNRDIYNLAENSKFRFDLLNRINTFEITIPPLRQRREDIPMLIEHYLKRTATRLGYKIPVLSSEGFEQLMKYSFPGNVRELKNIIESLIMLSEGKSEIKKEAISKILKLSPEKDKAEISITNLDLQENEIKLVMLALKKCNNVQKNAAKLLGISQFALSRKLKAYKENGIVVGD